MSRDWQKDKRYLQELNNWEMDPDDEDLYKIATHYHQQYAAEERHNVKLCKQILETELREKKLREAIDDLLSIFNHEGSWRSVEVSDGFVYALWDSDSEKIKSVENMLDSLYPKEETKQ